MPPPCAPLSNQRRHRFRERGLANLVSVENPSCLPKEMADLLPARKPMCFQGGRAGEAESLSPRCPGGAARKPPPCADLFYFLGLYALATFIYLFPKGCFWRLPGLLCSKAPFSRISSPLLELQRSFVRPRGSRPAAGNFSQTPNYPLTSLPPGPAPLGACIFSFVTLIADSLSACRFLGRGVDCVFGWILNPKTM